MQGSFAPVRVPFSPFGGSKILLPIAQKTFGFYKLVWKSKKLKIKHSTLIRDYSEGGLKDVDIKSN